MDQIEKREQLTVFAVPCSRSFVIKPEKWEEFINQKPNPEIRRQMEEIAKKFKVNNLVSTEKQKKRIKIKR